MEIQVVRSHHLPQQLSKPMMMDNPAACQQHAFSLEDISGKDNAKMITPSPHDVLLGRGGFTNNHEGNINFRKLVCEHKRRYLECSKADKPKVAREVVQIWRKFDPPGRFLQRMDDKMGCGSTSTDNANTAIWYDVGDKKAREKASQCLRERTRDVIPYLKKLQEEHTNLEKESEAICVELETTPTNKEGDDDDDDDLGFDVELPPNLPPAPKVDTVRKNSSKPLQLNQQKQQQMPPNWSNTMPPMANPMLMPGGPFHFQNPAHAAQYHMQFQQMQMQMQFQQMQHAQAQAHAAYMKYGHPGAMNFQIPQQTNIPNVNADVHFSSPNIPETIPRPPPVTSLNRSASNASLSSIEFDDLGSEVDLDDDIGSMADTVKSNLTMKDIKKKSETQTTKKRKPCGEMSNVSSRQSSISNTKREADDEDEEQLTLDDYQKKLEQWTSNPVNTATKEKYKKKRSSTATAAAAKESYAGALDTDGEDEEFGELTTDDYQKKMEFWTKAQQMISNDQDDDDESSNGVERVLSHAAVAAKYPKTTMAATATNEDDDDDEQEGELTLDEYQRSLEAYLANNQVMAKNNGMEDEGSEYEEMLTDDGMETGTMTSNSNMKKQRPKRRKQRRREKSHSSKAKSNSTDRKRGVSRNISKNSMMSMQSFKSKSTVSSVSIITWLDSIDMRNAGHVDDEENNKTDAIITRNRAAATPGVDESIACNSRTSKLKSTRSTGSNRSLMSELTDISHALDNMTIGECSTGTVMDDITIPDIRSKN